MSRSYTGANNKQRMCNVLKITYVFIVIPACGEAIAGWAVTKHLREVLGIDTTQRVQVQQGPEISMWWGDTLSDLERSKVRGMMLRNRGKGGETSSVC